MFQASVSSHTLRFWTYAGKSHVSVRCTLRLSAGYHEDRFTCSVARVPAVCRTPGVCAVSSNVFARCTLGLCAGCYNDGLMWRIVLVARRTLQYWVVRWVPDATSCGALALCAGYHHDRLICLIPFISSWQIKWACTLHARAARWLAG